MVVVVVQCYYATDAYKICLCSVIYLCVRYDEILLQQDPLPTYGLKLLLALLEQHPAFIRCLDTNQLSEDSERLFVVVLQCVLFVQASTFY